jgi:alpha-ketoglutarate-dependent taurine dioxygenase
MTNALPHDVPAPDSEHPWSSARLPDCSFGAIITSDGTPLNDFPVDRLRELVRKHRLVLLRGFTHHFSDPEILTAYARRWGEIMMWPFGPVLDIKAQEHPKEHIYDNSYVPLHWDGMYRETIPEFQFFHCISSTPDDDGRTVFLDTAGLVAETDERTLSKWRDVSFVYRVEYVTYYGGKVHAPLLEKHPISGEEILRYGEPAHPGRHFLNPHTVTCQGIDADDLVSFQQDLHERLRNERYRYAHRWQAGDMLIADNFALLHGREGFTKKNSRHLQRVHIHASPVYVNANLRDSGT